MKISIIIPFYKGNQYLGRLFKSIDRVVEKTKDLTSYEVLIVNDSPEEIVQIPTTIIKPIIIQNELNFGIQKSRINGYKAATGDWILFLDQDDEIVEEGFKKQLELTKISDVVVGNGIYNLGNVKRKIYSNDKVMQYLLQENMFLKIRNLIPSPGECLIKKSSIPATWIENNLKINGADDWFLWICLFKSKKVFKCNDSVVYIHNDTEGENLSADLTKMKNSSIEMLKVLDENNVLNTKEKNKLKKAIEFKYLQDTKKLTFNSLWKYKATIFDNVIYKLIVYIS